VHLEFPHTYPLCPLSDLVLGKRSKKERVLPPPLKTLPPFSKRNIAFGITWVGKGGKGSSIFGQPNVNSTPLNLLDFLPGIRYIVITIE
jgi:hypothetical protein